MCRSDGRRCTGCFTFAGMPSKSRVPNPGRKACSWLLRSCCVLTSPHRSSYRSKKTSPRCAYCTITYDNRKQLMISNAVELIGRKIYITINTATLKFTNKMKAHTATIHHSNIEKYVLYVCTYLSVLKNVVKMVHPRIITRILVIAWAAS